MTSRQQTVTALRHGIAWQRSITWHWQDRAGTARTPTEHAERHTTSVAFLRWIDRLWLHRRIAARRRALRAQPAGSVQAIICRVFGSYCSQAIAVARCESGFSIWAENGQYVNIFQMGYNERRTYGWHVAGSSALIASEAAYRYFVASGRDWSPWSCKP